MTKKLLPMVLISASALLALSDTGFDADTTIQLGDKAVPLAIETALDTVQNDSIITWDTLYTDSWGRLLKSDAKWSGRRDSLLAEFHSTASLNSASQVMEQTSSNQFRTPDFYRDDKDTLSGETWNENGLIEEGTIRKKTEITSSQFGRYDFEATQQIRILYEDSLSIVPIDTVILSSEGFCADTIIKAGALVKPVKKSSSRGDFWAPWNWANGWRLKDSLGRPLFRYSKGGNAKNGTYSSSREYLSLDTSDNVYARIETRNSSYPGASVTAYDTVWGESWNSKGRILKGNQHVVSHTQQGKGGTTTTKEFRIIYAYDSTGVHEVARHTFSDSGFVPDHLYKAGAIHIPVKQMLKDNPDIEKHSILQDSLGRIIYKAYGPYTSNSSNRKYSMEFNDANRVVKICSFKGSFGTVTSYVSVDTLVGKTWNDKGMILDGDLDHYSRQMSPAEEEIIDTVYQVTLVYDSTGLFPVDTIYHKETAVISENVQKVATFAATIENKTLRLQGLDAHEAIRVVGVNGRLLMQGVANANGALQLPMHSLSSGIHFLVSDKRRIRFVK